MEKIKIKGINLKKAISKETWKLIWIDVVFYFYITIGFGIFGYMSYEFKISPETSSIVWVMILIPLLILKLRKDALAGERFKRGK